MSQHIKAMIFGIALAVAGAVPALAQTDRIDNSYITADMALPADDVLALQQVIHRLNHALDAADYELYGNFFADDGVFVSGFGNAIGPAAIADALEGVSPYITNKRHVAGNLVISGSGNSAVVTSYLIVFERETGLEFVGSAINTDTLERRGDAWKVTRHESYLDPATARSMQAIMETQDD